MARVKKEETPVVPPVTPESVPAPKVEAKPITALYASKSLRMFHPDQQKYLLPGEPVELEMDSWLRSQVIAGLVSIVGQ